VLIVRPLFWKGELYGFACNRGHWADIGGMGPGSYSPSNPEIFQEGLFIPPVKLFSAGKLNKNLQELVLGNIRNRDIGHGDLRAQYASCHTAQRRVEMMINRYGFETVRTGMADILDRSETLARNRLRDFPNGTYRSRDCLDGDGLKSDPVWIVLELTIKDGEIIADLSDSDPQTSGGMNCTRSSAHSAVQYVVKCMSDPQNPTNGGSYRPVKVITRPGTVLDALSPAGTVGMGEVSYRVMDCAFAALSQAMPDRAVASGSGSTGTVTVGGRRDEPGRGQYFYTIELSSGAWGARHHRDGINAMRYGIGNAGHVPIEADEMENPLFFERYEILPDTGGAGRFRGGNGFVRAFRVQADGAKISTCADRHVTRPPGIFGGHPGTCARYVLDPGTDRERILPSKTPYLPIERDTFVWVQSGGGGGLGNPREREREKVLWDLKINYITKEVASDVYGIDTE
jgi:N-methylhydantoinase B